MPSEDTKILEFNQYRKSDKTPSIIYVHLEFLLKRTDEYKNIFWKFIHSKKKVNIFPVGTQCLRYGYLMV